MPGTVHTCTNSDAPHGEHTFQVQFDDRNVNYQQAMIGRAPKMNVICPTCSTRQSVNYDAATNDDP